MTASDELIESTWGVEVARNLRLLASTSVLDLGSLYISDFLAPGEQPRADPFPLELVMDDDGLVHLTEQPPAELMWGRYWYRSGTNASMLRELGDVVDWTHKIAGASDGDLWVDIACNDGTLLRQTMGLGYKRVGVDPAEESIAYEARKWCEPGDGHYPVPFDYGVAPLVEREHGKAKVITCIAMFYDLMDPTDFLNGIVDLLADDGLLVLQMSYTPLMLDQLAFDNICHEHARYYTLATLGRTLAAHGLTIVDAELNDTNGGSIRVAVRHESEQETWGSAPRRDVARYRLSALASWEEEQGYNTPEAWYVFRDMLADLRSEVVDYVIDRREHGCYVWGYGASTKGNTLLQYFGLDHTMIDAIAERQPGKVGLRTIGTDIPIVSEAEMRVPPAPDYLLMLPWHFVSEFTKRESVYLAAGGRFIVPCPRFEVIG